MRAQFTTNDGISAELRKRIRKLDSAQREEALTIMGEMVRDWALEAFTDESKRVRPWPAKKDGTPATLQLTGALRLSYVRGVVATPRVVTIASDRDYALRHQVGDANPGMPARPLLPVDAQGELPAELRGDMEAALGDWLGQG